MGCDIHAFFEIKLDGKWHTYSQPRIERNYKLFAKMANVRNDGSIKPISMPKGLPKDISAVVKVEADHWKLDAHSHSYFDANEISKIIEFHEKMVGEGDAWKIHHFQWGYLFGNGWNSFKKYRDQYPKAVEDIRLVFWFDN